MSDETRIDVEYGYTKQPVKYEAEKLPVRISRTLNPGEIRDAAWDAEFAKAKSFVLDRLGIAPHDFVAESDNAPLRRRRG